MGMRLPVALPVSLNGGRLEIVQHGGNDRRSVGQFPKPVFHHDLNLADLAPVISFPTSPIGSGKGRGAQKYRFLASQRPRNFNQYDRVVLRCDNLDLFPQKQVDADQLGIGDDMPELLGQLLRIGQRHGLKIFFRRFDHTQKQRSADCVGEG